MTDLAITFDDVTAAARRLEPVAHRTPVLRSQTFDELVGATVLFKMESLQRGGAFKFRGAYNSVSQLGEQQRARGVVAFSSGNHAQAVAFASRLLGVPATIVMPADAPASKRAATEGYGATVRTYDRYTEDRRAIAAQIAEQTGAHLIPPYDDPAIMAGQGTAGLELLDETGPLDVVVAPVGGGGLLSGVAVATRAMSPDAEIYGVEPEAGNDAQRSLRDGAIVTIDTPQTIADGAQTQFLGEHTFPVLQALLSGIVTVTDQQLVDQMRFFAARMKQVVEPTGALAAAALLAGKLDIAGKRVGVIVSGGNIDLNRFAALISD
ncbi:threo-3-hydroxy-L-aspartate ammonia-lyase [Epidermidibacterium keratini]|uniref:threonine ammonia-lyase n=1 Tax=Epidermidibacterium keratini TaxID=1891644 RepID=A0A7L4YR79_9ACTN|nr:threo-3-hydroxy-L-aspartate ammonia-lyase [Epidermidibacterium keratini]QHC01656.1 threo-3-hydroxy-L-aspartate ammonia-lyase [Epidermidibacterium keratini]